MNQKAHNQIVSFIWGIADDVLRDVFVRGKYRDIILPFTVLRRLDALLVPTKEKVLEANTFLIKQNIDDKKALENQSGYSFWNISRFTFETLMNDADNIDTNLEAYLDGYSPNVQEIISKFKLRNQLETMKEAGVTYLLIEKLCNKEINLSPNEAKNSKGETLPPLTNLGMGYVFEELIRKFNEENNEEAGEHFTPREIIKLMTHILFSPVKDKIKKGTYLIYDPACGSGGMLTEAENFEYFGYHKITVERPLRLSAQFTPEAISPLRFDKNIAEEMEWAYTHFGDDLYKDIHKYKDKIEAHLSKNEVKLKPADKSKLLNTEHWKMQLALMQAAQKIADKLGNKQFDDYNRFVPLLSKTLKELKLDLDAKGLKSITDAITWKNEDAEPVIKTSEKNRTIVYEADSELRDTENVPLDQDIHNYFEREVLQHVPDAWIDESKTVKGYEISFTRYFYNYVPPRSIEEITAEIFELEKETEGILNEIVND